MHAARPSRQWGSSGAPFSLRRTETAGRGAGAPNSAVVILLTRQWSPASSKTASASSAQVQSPPAARCQSPKGAPPSTSSRVAAARCPTNVGLPRWSSTTATSSRSAPSRSIVRTKLWPGRAEEPRAAHDPGALAGRGLGVQLRAPVGRKWRRAVRLHVGRSLAAVEDVVRRVRDQWSAELRGMRGAADVHLCRALGIVLRAVDVRPGRGMQDEIGSCERRGRREPDVPVVTRERLHVVRRERLRERDAELAARAGDQDATAWSRAESVGICVLHRCLTRGSSQAIPCSSGSAGSYSSVTW